MVAASALQGMNAQTRKKLVQLACVAAWSDMDLAESEREVVMGLAMEMALDEDDLDEVKTWLKRPPPEFDPYDIPTAHRTEFVAAFRKVIEADGRIDPEESEAIQLICQLVGGC